MFSQRTVLIVLVVFLIATSIIFLFITARRPNTSLGTGRISVAIMGPFQAASTRSIRSLRDIWKYYFILISTAKKNDRLKKELNRAVEIRNQCNEIRLSNLRLRGFLNFKKTETGEVIAAEVIGKDSSPWFKTVIIDKGLADGVERGMPVVVPEGIVGQVVNVSGRYSKVLLIIDINSAVDALVQRSRARGIIKGRSVDRCLFKYVLRKNDVKVGDIVVSSGLDGVYPKGLRIGHVAGIVRRSSGIFQEVAIAPYVDFDNLEEVLVVLLKPPDHEFVSK
jgi:rod shape-determining protein MreC